MGMSKDRKAWYFGRMEELIQTYAKLFVVSVDNVGSNQMQQIRLALRPLDTVILMGTSKCQFLVQRAADYVGGCMWLTPTLILSPTYSNHLPR